MEEGQVRRLIQRSRLRGIATYGQTRGGERSGRWELVVIGGYRLGIEDFDEAARTINATPIRRADVRQGHRRAPRL